MRPFIDFKVNWLPHLQAAVDYLLEQIAALAGGGPHTHEIADVTGLQDALDGKEASGTAAAAVAAHAGAADPHPTYLTLVEADALYEPLGEAAAERAAHEAAGNPHPQYLTEGEADALYEELGAVATHAGLADPHTQYQRESEKNAANGYAGLDGSSKLTGSQQVYGSGANTACQGNDARLSDARTPTAHETSHRSGGSDALNVTQLAGFPGGSTNFLRADGTFAAPPAGGGGDLVYAPTPADTAINNTSDVTIVTRDVTSVAAGDQVIIEGEFIILNNSGAARNYIVTVDFDGATDIELTLPALAASATLMHPVFFRATCNVRSTSLAYVTVMLDMQLAAGIAAGTDTTAAATHLSAKGWGTSASNLTGTLTCDLKIRSANATATQTCRLVGFTIRKVSPT